MNEFENTMELSVNPYDDLIETKEEPVVSPVILNGKDKNSGFVPHTDPVEIIPLASDVIHTKVTAEGWQDVWAGEIELEEDLLVPDTEADMEMVLNMEAGIVSVSIAGGPGSNCELKGSLKITAMYRAAGIYNNAISVINSDIQFKRNIECSAENVNEMYVSGEVKKISYSIINERKYRVKLQLAVAVKGACKNERNCFEGIEGQDLYVKKEPVKIANMISASKRESEVNEELPINNEKIRPLKILKSAFTVAENHRKLTEGKLIVNSTVWVRIVYMAEIASKGNLSGQPMFFLGKIDHTQFITLGKSEIGAAACTVHSCKADLKVDINDNASGFRVYGDLITDVEFYSFIEKELVTDMYHTCEEMTFDKKNEIICAGIESVCVDNTLRETISLKDGGDDQRIVYLDAQIQGYESEIKDNKIFVSGKLQLEAVTINDGDYTSVARKVCDFNCSTDAPEADSNCSIRIKTDRIFVREVSGDISGGAQINLTVHVQAQLTLLQECNIGMISNPCFLRTDEKVKDYPITVYTVKENESVWDIAKRFRVDEKNITEINRKEDICAGKKIVIVK